MSEKTNRIMEAISLIISKNQIYGWNELTVRVNKIIRGRKVTGKEISGALKGSHEFMVFRNGVRNRKYIIIRK